MKVIKVTEGLHSSLKGLSEDEGISISQVIESRVGDNPVVSSLNRLSDQILMIHGRLDEIEDRLDSPKNNFFSESDEVTGTSLQPQETIGEYMETKQEKFLRIKAEQEAREKAQKHAIAHPEDVDQSGGWS